MRSIVGKEEAGRNKPPLFRRIVCEKAAAKLAKSPLAALKALKAAPHSAVRQFLRASFYHSTKIRLSAHFAPAGNLLGSTFPKPCYGGWCRQKPRPPERYFCAGNRTEVSDHAKEIQHAPPQLGNQNPHDGRGIRRVLPISSLKSWRK